MHPLFLQLGCIAADTQYHADVGTVDESGCTTLADEWKRLSRDGCQTYGNHHVEQRLRDEQIAAMIGCGEIDMLLFFRDPVSAKPGEPNDVMLLRLCDMHTIPVATNIATAEVLIHGLERGDLAWIELQRGRK